MTPTFSSDAAEGLVFKPTSGTKVHTADLVAGHAKVQVDIVKDNCLPFPLEIPPNDEVLTLGAAKGTFIQWPKCDIVIKLKARHHPRPPAQAPPPVQAPPPPHFDPSPLGVEDAPVLPVVRARSSPTVSQHKRGRGPGRQTSERPVARKLDLGKRPAHSVLPNVPVKTTAKAPAQFTLGMPLVDDLTLRSVGPACQDLHAWYMKTVNSTRKNKEDCIMGAHGCEPFMSPSNIFIVGFNDLWDLFNFNKLDIGLIKCYAL